MTDKDKDKDKDKISRIRKIFYTQWDIEKGVGEYDGEKSRASTYEVPLSLHKRFTFFTRMISRNSYYQTTSSIEKGIAHTTQFSTKCNIFIKYINNHEISTISDVKKFLVFLNMVIEYEPATIHNWKKDIDTIIEENIIVEKTIDLMYKRYIRVEKINKLLC